jgi:hypothetical protein
MGVVPRLLQPSTTYEFRVKLKNKINNNYSPSSDTVTHDTRAASLGEVRLANAELTIVESTSSIDIKVTRFNGLFGTLYTTLIARQSEDVNVRSATSADFVPFTSNLVFSSREKEKIVTLELKPDDVFEYPNERLVIELQDVAGQTKAACATGGDCTTVITILDDGDSGIIQLTDASMAVSVIEGTDVVVTVTRTGGLSGDIRIDVETIEGSATFGDPASHAAFTPGADCSTRTVLAATSDCPDPPNGDFVEPSYLKDGVTEIRNRIQVTLLDGQTEKTFSIKTRRWRLGNNTTD